MNKVSSKLAASVRKVKGQDDQPATTQPTTRETETRRAAPKPAPAPMHPERVWPD